MNAELSQGEIIKTVYRALPYSHQIERLTFGDVHAIRFDWRGNTYRVSSTLHVEEVTGSMLAGTSSALLMQQLLTNDRAPKRPRAL